MAKWRNNYYPGKKASAQAQSGSVLERIAEFYHKTLFSSEDGLSSLRQLGLADNGLTEAHSVGYCDGSLKDTLPDEGPVLEELRSLGILAPLGQETFLGSIVFPINDCEGALVTLAARKISNSQESTLPQATTSIWNARACRLYSDIVVTTTIADALSLELAGVGNMCAVFSAPTPQDLELLKELGVRSLTVAGRAETAMARAEQLKDFECLVKGAGDKSLNHILLEKGKEGLASWLEKTKAKPMSGAPAMGSGGMEHIQDGFATNLGGRHYEIRGLEKRPRKLHATVRVEHGGRLHIDTVDLYSARARRTLCEDLSRTFEQGALEIQADIAKLIRMCEEYRPVRPQEDPGEAAVVISEKEREEAIAFGKDPDLLERIKTDYQRCGLVGEESNKLLCYLAAVSRKLPDPLSVLILSSSGAGKSSLQDTTLSLCPPEDVVKLTSLSGRALFYKSKNSLKHKILALEEEAGAETAVYALRNLISAKELIIESTVKDLGTGRMTTMQNRVEGPTSVFVTTTNPETDPETRSRFFVTSVDESREQTRAILEYQRRLHAGEASKDEEPPAAVIRRHHNFQRLLKPVLVINPFATQLVYLDDRLQSRRDQPKYLNLINAVAFLRQMGRRITSDGAQREVIRVEPDDIRIANELACELLGQSLSDLNRVSRQLLMLIEKMVESRRDEARKADPGNIPPRSQISFTRRDIREHAGWPHTRVVRYLKQLVDLEYVLKESGRRGVLHTYRLAYNGLGKEGEKFVMKFDMLEKGGH